MNPEAGSEEKNRGMQKFKIQDLTLKVQSDVE